MDLRVVWYCRFKTIVLISADSGKIGLPHGFPQSRK